ncbi:hypothetical protein J2S46_004277 [Kitasatospora herbaricolor]|nr:hypothetical protein [Kitasatospora herbaricolor]
MITSLLFFSMPTTIGPAGDGNQTVPRLAPAGPP